MRLRHAALLLFAALSPLFAEAQDEDEPALELPPLKRLPEHSFRAIQDDSRIPGFGISGHSSKLPTSNDFLRLVPPLPLSYGAVFSSKPLPSSAKDWVVEVAFRVHGQAKRSIVVPGQEAQTTTAGGRGLALWVSKSANPTFVTLPGDPKKPIVPAPPTLPSNKEDDSVSFFGYKAPFEGLGVIFDTAPSSPLYRRSEKKGYATDEYGQSIAGADSAGVISGMLDDGTGDWLETPEFRASTAGQAFHEAKYLDNSQGECEAAFRNAPGLVWARVTHLNDQIRVDLDLTPHTTLSTSSRVFSHHCFTIKGVRLPPGYHIGLTGLASGNPNADSVDVYAFEAWEVLKGASADRDEYGKDVGSRAQNNHALAGTSGQDAEATVNFAQEVFASQAKMFRQIEAISARLDQLSAQLGSGGSTGGNTAGNGQLEQRLATLDSRLSEYLAGSSSGNTNMPALVQQTNKIVADLARMQPTIDGLQSKLGSTTQSFQSRTGEILSLLNRSLQQMTLDREKMQSQIAATAASSTGKRLLMALAWLLGLAGVGFGGMKIWSSRSQGYRGGKKMI